MKKIISIFLAMLMTFACFGAVSVSAETPATAQEVAEAMTAAQDGSYTIWVKNGGTGTGATNTTPADSIDTALKALAKKLPSSVSSTPETKIYINFVDDYVWTLASDYTMPTGIHWNVKITIGGSSVNNKLVFDNTANVQKAFNATYSLTFNKCTVVAIGSAVQFNAQGYTLNFGVSNPDQIDVLAPGQTVEVGGENKTTTGVNVSVVNAGRGTEAWSGRVTLLAGSFDWVYGSNSFAGTVKYQNDKLLVVGEKATVNNLILFRLNGTTTFTGNKDSNKPVNIDINGTINSFFFTNRTSDTGITFDGKLTIKFGPKAKVNAFQALSTSNNFIFGETGTVAGGMHFKGGFTVDVSEMTDSANVKKILETVKTWKEGVLSGMEVVHVKPVALQAGAATDSSIRILLGINAYEGLNASVEIKETSSVKAATVELTEVYTSVLAVDGTDITTVAATDKDVAYLMAVVITDLPVGVYTFDVTPIVNGVRGTTTTITHTVTASAT